MWHALRAELAYYRSYLFGGLGLATGVAVLVSVVFYAAGEEGPPVHAANGIRGMFFIMAPMIVGFVIQGTRPEEKRELLLLSGPLTPRQIAGARVCMSVVLLAIGMVAAGAMMWISYLVTGTLVLESLHIAGFVGGIMFAILHMIPLAQEAVAAREQQRHRAATLGWLSFGLAILFFSLPSVGAFAFQGEQTWPSLHIGNLIVAATAMIAGVKLYTGRTDFTR